MQIITYRGRLPGNGGAKTEEDSIKPYKESIRNLDVHKIERNSMLSAQMTNPVHRFPHHFVCPRTVCGSEHENETSWF